MELDNVLGDIKDRVISIDQLNAIGQSVARIQEMIEETQKKTEESALMIANGKSKNETCVRMGTECRDRLQALNEHFKSIEQLLKTIDQISVKTTLLALNAKTEAARAGEHGRGFSVVANEIGVLAASSMKAKNQIQSILESIQDASTEVTESFSRSGNSLKELLNYNDRIAGNINDISQESNELKESMDRASGGLHKLTDSVEAVNSKLGDFTVLGRSLGFLVVLKNAEHPVDLAFDCLGRFEAMAAKGSPVAGRTPPEPSLAIDFAQDQVLISQTDPRGVISYANNDFCEVSGYLFEELVGKPHNIIRHPFMPRGAFGNMWATLKAGEVWQGIVVNKTKDEGHYWVKATVYPNFDNGTVVGYTSLRTKPTPEQVRRAIAAYQYIP